MSKAQGLPFNVIIIAAISALALIVVIIFFMTAGSSVFGEISTATGSEQERTYRSATVTCSSRCNQVQMSGGEQGAEMYCNAFWPAEDLGLNQPTCNSIVEGVLSCKCDEITPCEYTDSDTGRREVLECSRSGLGVAQTGGTGGIGGIGII